MLFDYIENGQGLPATITAAAGTVSVNTSKEIRGLARLLYVKATTASTTFDFKIIDKNSRTVRHYQDEGGSDEGGILRDINILPMFGKYTFTIEKSSLAKDTFDIMIMLEERP